MHGRQLLDVSFRPRQPCGEGQIQVRSFTVVWVPLGKKLDTLSKNVARLRSSHTSHQSAAKGSDCPPQGDGAGRMAPLAFRWLALLPVLLLLQVGGLMPAPSPTRGPLRGSAIHLGLVFPDSQEGTPADPRSWRKGTVGDSSTTYWWRKGVHESDAPEVSSTPPAEDWKVGKLENGREFLWREGNDPDDPEIALQGSEVEATSAPDTSPDGWRIGVLASGRRYLWRGSAEDPEVRFWDSSTLESGNVFWYTGDGHVSLKDPFDLRSRQELI